MTPACGRANGHTVFECTDPQRIAHHAQCLTVMIDRFVGQLMRYPASCRILPHACPPRSKPQMLQTTRQRGDFARFERHIHVDARPLPIIPRPQPVPEHSSKQRGIFGQQCADVRTVGRRLRQGLPFAFFQRVKAVKGCRIVASLPCRSANLVRKRRQDLPCFLPRFSLCCFLCSRLPAAVLPCHCAGWESGDDRAVAPFQTARFL